MNNCKPQLTDQLGIFRCPICGLKNPRPIAQPFYAICRTSKILSQDIVSKAQRYLHERDIWKKAGKPLRSKEEIFRIFTEECMPCEHFNKKSEKLGQCKICGCYLKPKSKSFNKIAYATTNCAMNPPKWEAEIKLEEEQEKELKQELEQEMFQVQTKKQLNGLQMKDKVRPNVNSVQSQPPKRKCCGG